MPYRDGTWRAPVLEVEVEPLDASTRVIAPRGELDVSTVGALDDAFRAQANGGGACRIVLDLAEISFIDSTAMALVAEWRDRLVGHGGGFALVTTNPHQKRLFHLTELTERLRVSDSRDQAVGALDHTGSGDERADRSF
jgi:anti-sigma B factor antagonist